MIAYSKKKNTHKIADQTKPVKHARFCPFSLLWPPLVDPKKTRCFFVTVSFSIVTVVAWPVFNII